MMMRLFNEDEILESYIEGERYEAEQKGKLEGRHTGRNLLLNV